LRRHPGFCAGDAVTAPYLLAQIRPAEALERQTMTTGINVALRRRLVGSALGGFIAFAAASAATAQWLPPWGAAAPPADIAHRLEAQGYVLIAPLQRRPGIYLADVSAGPGGFQRLVIDARSGAIVERFLAPPRTFSPEFAVRYDEFGEPPRPGPGFSATPYGGPPAKSAEGGPTNVRIPSAVSPFGSQLAPALTKPKPKSAATDRKTPSAKTSPTGAPPLVTPPLPPPAPREAAKPEESAPPTPKPEPKIESPPGETENASTTSAPTILESKPEAANDEPQRQAQQTQPATATQSPGAGREPAAAPVSSAEGTAKSKVSIVPAAVFE
jgi:hypothetical protein